MKRIIVSCSLVAASAMALVAFKSADQASITGKIIPAEGAEKVWAISATDTLESTIAEGSFSFEAKAGTYQVTIDGKEPYKDVTIDNVQVAEGTPVDLGEIQLQQ